MGSPPAKLGVYRFNYTVLNNDSSPLANITTYFKVTTTDGSVFTESDIENNIPSGTTRATSASVNTLKKKASSVVVVSYSEQ